MGSYQPRGSRLKRNNPKIVHVEVVKLAVAWEPSSSRLCGASVPRLVLLEPTQGHFEKL